MTEQRDELTMLPEELLKFLGALLPDENGYGRRSFDDGASALNTVGEQVLDRGRPVQGYETIAAALAETSMTLEVSAWSGLDAEPTLEHAFWGSRLGLVSSRSRGAGPIVLEHHAGESLYAQVFDAAGLGPRPSAQGQTLVTVKPAFLTALLPGAATDKREAALAKLVDLLRAPAPELAADLEAARVRFLTLETSLFCAEGLREHSLAWLDTPSGVIVPLQQGGVFTRQQFALTMMPSWLVWKHILDVLPNGEDVELWNELAAATASERVGFGGAVTNR